jgi:hypothetical protein
MNSCDSPRNYLTVHSRIEKNRHVSGYHYSVWLLWRQWDGNEKISLSPHCDRETAPRLTQGRHVARLPYYLAQLEDEELAGHLVEFASTATNELSGIEFRGEPIERKIDRAIKQFLKLNKRSGVAPRSHTKPSHDRNHPTQAV